MSKAARSTRFVLLRAAVTQTGVSATRQGCSRTQPPKFTPKCDREHRNGVGVFATVLQEIYRLPSPKIGRLMLRHERRSKVLAKLTNARCELEDALNLSTPAARYDPVTIPEPARNRLAGMIDDLKNILCEIEGSQ
jgi:hypothetical protein